MKTRARRVLTPEERTLHKKHALTRTLVIDVLVIIVSAAILGLSIGKWFTIGGRSTAVGGHVLPGGIGISATGLTGSIVKAYLLSARAHYKARDLRLKPKKVGDRRLRKYMKLKNKISKLYDGAHVRVGIAESPAHDDDLEKERRGLADH